MPLKEELKQLIGLKRRFILFRIAEVEADVARKMCNVPLGTYNSWFKAKDGVFQALYKRVEEFTIEYKQEAIQMLRRDNQLSAVILEEQIINKMKEEVESGEYNLIRTNLARDVYTRLMSELDIQPSTTNVTWSQKVNQLFMGQNSGNLPPTNPIQAIEETVNPLLEEGKGIIPINIDNLVPMEVNNEAESEETCNIPSQLSENEGDQEGKERCEQVEQET